jgi:uncharacterized protein with von Willebrand factor type A (vWA) domain
MIVRELRSRGVGVGMQEVVALAGALARGLHESSLEQFYRVARALLIHDESDLDEFDRVFSHVFKGVAYSSVAIAQELRDWLADPVARRELSEEERAALQELSPDELLRMFEERLREQKERHDGGNYWIGTGGTSPFGTGGYHPSGLSLRNSAPGSMGGGRSMIRSADARRYRGLRHDLTLDTRQIEIALRKLRTFDRDGLRAELDVDATVDATARAFGELEPVFRKPRRPNTRVILMMDVGGSMDPFAQLASQLFSAAKRATHWRELRTYYFHNCVYSRVFRTEGLREPMFVRDLLRECDARYKLILVGDAAMAPYELLTEDFTYREKRASGLDWLKQLRTHFPDSVWLNPDPPEYWRGGTAQAIAGVFPMHRLTLQGLEEALARLARKR